MMPGKLESLRSNPGLMTLTEAADFLQIAPGTLKHWVAQKRIEHIKIGRLTRFRRGALENYIAAQTVRALTD